MKKPLIVDFWEVTTRPENLKTIFQITALAALLSLVIKPRK